MFPHFVFVSMFVAWKVVCSARSCLWQSTGIACRLCIVLVEERVSSQLAPAWNMADPEISFFFVEIETCFVVFFSIANAATAVSATAAVVRFSNILRFGSTPFVALDREL